ncbi:MAG: oxidoreductase [Niabella sp.]
MKKVPVLLMFTCFFCVSLSAQKLVIPSQDTKTSFRGLSIAKNCIWVSGSGGTVGRSTDAGKTWQWFVVPGQEKNEFRDVEALDSNTAIVMGIAAPAYIFKTSNGGKTWKKVYQNNHPSMFLDAMAFKNREEGMVVGDPIDGKIFVAETKDGGHTWRETNKLNLPEAKDGEAFFAASGTNTIWSGSQYYIVSGGITSRIFMNKTAVWLPTTQGSQMKGANGLAVQGKNILVAGGDYHHLNKADSAFVYSIDAGKTWELPSTPTGGYRSCICFAGKDTAVAVGLSGIDITYDAGKNWKTISREGFNTCAYSSMEKAVYLVGNNGRLGKLFPSLPF